MQLSHVTLVVKDQTTALEFYTRTLGFERRADYTLPGHPRWLTVGPKGQPLELVLWAAGAASDGVVPASLRDPGNGTGMVLEVDDCRRLFAELKAKGVRFKEETPLVAAWGVAAHFTDPDGNPFTLHETASGPPPAVPARSGA
ncbi:MAG: VOC family protein [Thermoplasmata archaeon]|nr:VOC family protein [Thermoplasmata archaeon]